MMIYEKSRAKAMQEELFQINTPETHGGIPSYAIQHHAISRGIYNISVTARKLIFMAMALLPFDLSSLTASFTFHEFCIAMDMPTSKSTYKKFKAAVEECRQSVIKVEVKPDEEGKKSWKEFIWYTVSTLDENTGQVTMRLSSELAGFLKSPQEWPNYERET
jgi:hypothetical protein